MYPDWVVSDGGLEAGGWLCLFIKTNIYFGFFTTLVSTELAPCLSQFCPHANRGFLSFQSKLSGREAIGHVLAGGKNTEPGTQGGSSKIGCQMESGVTLTPLVGCRRNWTS